MSIRVDYEIRHIPNTYVTKKMVCKMEEVEGGRKNRWGEKPHRLARAEEETRGGILVRVKGSSAGDPGHSYRLESLEQALDFKLIDADQYEYLRTDPNGILKVHPRLIDEQTGEQVNEHGIPIEIARTLHPSTRMMRDALGSFDMDVGVRASADDFLGGGDVPVDDVSMTGSEHVVNKIEELEE